MKMPVMIAGAMLLVAATPVSAHRADEYLQATTISVENGRVQANIRLIAGMAVYRTVLRKIDRDADGAISALERRAYGEAVLSDVSLKIDGKRVGLQLVRWTFPDLELMKDGRGPILLELAASTPGGTGHRRLLFENHHQQKIAEYLVNVLVPSDTSVRITAQRRNYKQSLYQLDYTVGEH